MKTVSYTSELASHQYTLLYDGQCEIGALDATGKIAQLRVPLESINAEIGGSHLFFLNGSFYTPTYDHRGNVCILSQEQPLQTYRYTGYGERTPTPNDICPWHFSSKRSLSHTSLSSFGRRDYDATLGRWLVPDPSGFEDGLNLYAYVHNSPMTHLDAWGLWDGGMHGRSQNEGALSLAEMGASFTGADPKPFQESRTMMGNYFSQAPLVPQPISDTWNHPRFQGGLQAIGGAGETLIGGGIALGSYGLLAPAGGAVMAHGLDHCFTGLQTMFSGVPRQTVTSQMLQKTGMSPFAANVVDVGISMTAPVVGLARLGAQQFKAVTTAAGWSSEAKAVGTTSTGFTSNALKQGKSKSPIWTEGSPFQGKTREQIVEMFELKGYKRKGANPAMGQGSYISPKGKAYRFDLRGQGRYPNEPSHLDVLHKKEFRKFMEKKRFGFLEGLE